MKSNNNPHILSAFAASGIGVDVVSGGELRSALACGFPPEKIVFSGVGKTKDEIELAINKNIRQIHIESEAELKRIIQIAEAAGKTARVAFRVNPDVNPETHPYITTGFRENKFGLEFQAVERLLKESALTKSIKVTGLTLHIGSQILDPRVFSEAIDKTLKVYRDYANKFTMLDIGGGLGIEYQNEDLNLDELRFRDYAEQLKKALSDIPEVLLEPGRFVVGRFGCLVSPVQYVKKTSHKQFLIISSGMNHIMRPALYEAFHRITLLRESQAPDETFDVVGPICESSDVLGRDRRLPSDITESDWLIIHDAGAYGYTMSNQYNMHDLPKEYVFSKGKLI